MDKKALDERIESAMNQLHRAENERDSSPEYLTVLRARVDHLILERQRLSQAEAKRKKSIFDR